ncbi:hypothetical protein C8J57DRAFT_1536902 [Mycena rebaudengoi]|nr:hypothetical protein C8J57DRAFT_1536902 [Mycena rebaudengoi]
MAENYSAYDPAVHTSVPSFWSISGREDEHRVAVYVECLVGTIFGAIHCMVWNSDFTSTVEMWMWRSCALSVTAIPPILALTIAAAVTGRIYKKIGLFLIVLPLIVLRAPAAGSLMDMNWSVYIPHL